MVRNSSNRSFRDSINTFGIALAFAGAGMWMFGLGVKAALEPIPPIINAVANAIVKIIGALGDFVMQIAELDLKKQKALRTPSVSASISTNYTNLDSTINS